MQNLSKSDAVLVDPTPVRAWRSLFNNTHWSWIWIPVRVYLSLMWIASGLHKLFEYTPVPNDIVGLQGIKWGAINQEWMASGEALKTFWSKAIKMDPQPVITFDWYRSCLQYLLDTHTYTWFAKIVVFGELAVGLALLLGAFTGIAAVFSMVMNFNYLMAGSNSLNPVMLLLALLLILAWKTAGWFGLDRFLYRVLGIQKAAAIPPVAGHVNQGRSSSPSMMAPEQIKPNQNTR